jgi:hypothetical protein
MDLKERRKSCELDTPGSRKRSVADCCKHNNETSASIRDGKFLDHLCDFSSRINKLYGTRRPLPRRETTFI